MATVPVTQAHWTHVVGSDAKPAGRRGMNLRMENFSWNTIKGPEGFLQRINSSAILATVSGQTSRAGKFAFRLPSETEWE